MDALPNEVLLDILEQLKLPTQLKLYGISSTFAHLMDYIWSRKYKNVNHNFELGRFTIKHLHYFFGSISPHIMNMKLFSLQQNELDVLLTYNYPQVRFLRLTLTKEAENSRIYYMQTLAASFPNIKGFFPEGRICGTFISQMKNLTHLNLSWCKQIDWGVIPKIVKALKLTWLRLQCTPLDDNASLWHIPDSHIIQNYGGLKSLFLNSNELKYFLTDDRDSMSSLRELAIYHPDSDILSLTVFRFALLRGRVDEIIESKTESVHDLWSDVYNDAFPNLNLRPMRLQKAVITCHPLALTWIPLPAQYPQLRELVFCKCRMLGSNSLNELMTRAQGVELIRIEYCRAEFHIISIDVLQIVQGRQKPLTLNFYKNYLTDDPDIDVIPILIDRHQLFKLTSNEPLPIEDNYLLHIKFDDVTASNASNDGDVTSAN